MVKTPWLLKKLYPNLVWNGNKDGRSIYLTFDDGPIPIVTPFVLNILKQYNARATFFCIGDNVRKHPEIYQWVISEGHAIGNHTFNHLKGWETEDEHYLDNFMLADQLMGSTRFRPPYGRIKRSQIKLLQHAKPGLEIVMWSVLSRDYDAALKPEKCLQDVLKHTKAGDIVLFHDSLKAMDRLAYVLPRALEYWSQQGFTFSALKA